MVHVNDDSNDELFRRAANDYLLKAEGPDWTKLVDKIDNTIPETSAAPEIKKKKTRFFFMAFPWPLKQKWGSSFPVLRIPGIHDWLKKSKKKVDTGWVLFLPVLLNLRFCFLRAPKGKGH